jgi:preprotein translocase subunit SecG
MWLIWLITVIHVIVCAVLILVVLLQHGKSADIAATFGGVGSQTAFGPRGTATLLSKLTTWCAIIFMLTSISLTILANRSLGSAAGSNSVMSGEKAAPAPSTPAAPAKK